MNDAEWYIGDLAIHGHVIYDQYGHEIASNVYRKEDAEQVVREHNAVRFALRNGEHWALSDWQNWLRNHARPTTTKEGE